MRKTEKIEVFKIQISLNSDKSSALIYNKDSSSLGMIPVTRSLLDLMEGRNKVYVLGRIGETGLLEITGEAVWQEW